MSPIFRHGRLRLYLLKLLDEAPRHGYEVIRLLQDRFMGVYSPSPGTIYPRLARLEEDGLVTHDEVDGRKVYRITEKGREEIRGRLDDLAELEEELTQSVRDIAREVSEDVRDTVRSLREEITWAARDVRRDGGAARAGTGAAGDADPASGGRPGGPDPAADEARRVRDEARQTREDVRDSFRSPPRGSGPDWSSWSDRAASWQSRGRRRDWGDRADWSGRKDEGDPGGWSGWPDWAGKPAGFERLAGDFARELRTAAGHAGDLGEGALGDLRNILADTLARIRDEVFAGGAGQEAGPETDPEAADPGMSDPAGGSPGASTGPADGPGSPTG